MQRLHLSHISLQANYEKSSLWLSTAEQLPQKWHSITFATMLGEHSPRILKCYSQTYKRPDQTKFASSGPA